MGSLLLDLDVYGSHMHACLLRLPTEKECVLTWPSDNDGLFNQPDMEFNLGVDMFQPTSWTGSNSNGPTSVSSPSFPAHRASPLLLQDALDTWQQRFNSEWALLSADDGPAQGDATVENATSPCADASQTVPTLPALTTVRSLSDLNVDLYTLSSFIPKPPTDISQPLSWKDKDFAIDKTFQLSQRFIEVLNKLYPRFLETAPISSAGSGSALRPDPSFDQASFLLVLSCYQRLVDAYDDIFGNMQACLNRSSTTAREDYVQMPDVRVGDFSLPNSSALQITLILQLARHLLRRLGDIIKWVDSGYIDASSNDLTSLTLKAVYTRESDLITRINVLRNTLISLNIL
ncbi:hypothetical protein P171DRAFT_431418 [Karstenula rhodostoma CBS 690.94]|uniref:Uncharacterized protein n=1 Tax=Karstenula rhodostoma CBS 690.94 TaxID=1392251 RepID=A0A9P4PKN9_9PLEO|nr:hypothetical protein P171DRAFT_431418 [Karstenula rhodostoma CBS 690.94]